MKALPPLHQEPFLVTQEIREFLEPFEDLEDFECFEPLEFREECRERAGEGTGVGLCFDAGLPRFSEDWCRFSVRVDFMQVVAEATACTR